MKHHFQATGRVWLELHVEVHWTTTSQNVMGLIFRFTIPNVIRVSPIYVPYYPLLLHYFCGKDTKYAVVTVV